MAEGGEVFRPYDVAFDLYLVHVTPGGATIPQFLAILFKNLKKFPPCIIRHTFTYSYYTNEEFYHQSPLRLRASALNFVFFYDLQNIEVVKKVIKYCTISL